ncbi:MAG: hypothetical protein V1911_03880 [Candidatus Micrarchaeota archaeon]
MITNYKEGDRTDKNRVLVWREGGHPGLFWREESHPGWYNIDAYEGILEQGKIKEGSQAVYSAAQKEGDLLRIPDFEIDRKLRRTGGGYGTAAREIWIRKAKNLGAKGVQFPTGREHYPEFYKQRGFKAEERHTATLNDLDYSKRKPGELVDWGKKLKDKGFKILWAKSRQYEKK